MNYSYILPFGQSQSLFHCLARSRFILFTLSSAAALAGKQDVCSSCDIGTVVFSLLPVAGNSGRVVRLNNLDAA